MNTSNEKYETIKFNATGNDIKENNSVFNASNAYTLKSYRFKALVTTNNENMKHVNAGNETIESQKFVARVMKTHKFKKTNRKQLNL